MRAPRVDTHAQSGFTLVEVIVAMMVTAILAVAVSIFLKPTLDAYFGTARHVRLADAAEGSLRRIGREVRQAVPNSLRLPAASASTSCFQFVPTRTGGRYRVANDANWDAAHAANPSLAVDGSGAAVSGFDVLSPWSTSPLAGDFVVIDNQKSDDVYNGVNRQTIASVSGLPDSSLGSNRITLTSAFSFPAGYTDGRFLVVPKDQPSVFYVCSGADGSVDAQGNGKGSLYRVVSDFATSACPSTSGAALVASKVKRCSFVYDPNQGATQQSGFLWLLLELAESNDAVTLSYGAHVDNVP